MNFFLLFECSFVSQKVAVHSCKVGLLTPRCICSSIWSRKRRKASRTSLHFFSTIYLRRGASSSRAVSDISSNQLLIKIPLSGCWLKFSATLSTIIVLFKGRPILERSLIKTIPVGVACCLYRRYVIRFSLSILSRTQSA